MPEAPPPGSRGRVRTVTIVYAGGAPGRALNSRESSVRPRAAARPNPGIPVRHHQRGRTLLEVHTTLAPEAVLVAAKRFFGTQSGIYAAFAEQESPRHVVLRGQGGEEIAIGVDETGGVTRVSGSSYLFDAQVARFLASLPPAVPAVEAAEAPAGATS